MYTYKMDFKHNPADGAAQNTQPPVSTNTPQPEGCVKDKRVWICHMALKLDLVDRERVIQFLFDVLIDKSVAKECADGTRINLDILSDDMIRIIYKYIHDTIVDKDGNNT